MKPLFFMRPPASGPLRGTAGQEVFKKCFQLLIRRGGVPSGAAVFIIVWREKRPFSNQKKGMDLVDFRFSRPDFDLQDLALG